MESQPNEIVTYILSYLDNRELNLARRVSLQWKKFIEERIFKKSIVPSLHVCILNRDYYHFGKYYLNYIHDEDDINYYGTLIILINDKYFINRFSSKNIVNMPNECVLAYSAQYGHFEVVKYMVNSGVDIHDNEDCCFRWSAADGHLDIVKYLIEKGADIHADVYYQGDYALRRSAENGHLDVVKYLIGQGADLHAGDDWAFQSSVANNKFDVAKYLIEQGANIHAENDFALQTSARKGYLDIVQYLISIGADKKIALKHGTEEVIRLIKKMN